MNGEIDWKSIFAAWRAKLHSAMLIAVAIGFGAVYGFFWTHNYLKPQWDIEARSVALDAFQRRAVKIGVGTWGIGKDGEPRFHFKTLRCGGEKK